MFTDDPVTPVRLEILLDVVRRAAKGLRRDDLYRVVQPEALAGAGTKFGQAAATLRAALELELVEDAGTISLTAKTRKNASARVAIQSAFDDRVLSNTDVEKYFALFYAYYLGLGRAVNARCKQNHQTWADQFNRDVFEDHPQPNPFNKDKLTGLHRWFGYVGLGWYDPTSTFQVNPFERIQRSLVRLFGRHRTLDADEFMVSLGRTCPELDGGDVFRRANRAWQYADRKCTVGLSHALVELHLDGQIRLNCPADSKGWSVEEVEPPRGGHFGSPRFSSVGLLARE